MVTDIIASFEKQCTLRPHEEAVRSASEVFTYAELDKCTNEISQSIKEIGLQVGSVVAVELSETAWDIVAVLGILRSHNAVLPIDPSNPDERNRYILRETDVKVCVRLEANKLQVLHLKNVANEIDKECHTHVHSEIKSGQWGDVGAELAYILYTSGSTGKPKGVAMGRQAISKLIHWQNHSDGKDSTLPTTQFAPLVFDVAFQEILSTLCAGGVLVLVPRDIRLNPESFIRFISRERIGRLFLPTVALHPLANAGLRMDGLPHLRHVYVAGEQLRITPTIREWFAEMSECMLHNHYGPTETHVVTSFTMQGLSRVWPDIPPIGVPLPHVMAVIANEEGEALPPGEIGELVIGGECLAFGYINRPDLTSERFIESKSWGRVYRTGDLAIIRDDIIEYKGRSDSQVKISGHRVELAEVEVVLCGHPDVTDAVVVADDVNGRQRLVAYVSSKIDQHRKERVIEREFSPPWRDHVASASRQKKLVISI